ncbi:myelin protein zero-like protein 2 [Symphorus nematophorus]
MAISDPSPLCQLIAMHHGVKQVSGIIIYTTSEVEAINGTNVKLKCIFRSSCPVLLRSISVAWYFRPQQPGPEESTSFRPTQGRFKDHVVWSADIMKNDASITLKQVPPTFSGTYICQVHNRPDVHGRNGEVDLRVIDTAMMS